MATAPCQYCKNPDFLPYLFIITILFFLMTPFATSLTFNYQAFAYNDHTLNLEGDVYYDNGALQLTKSEKDSLGRVKYYNNLHLWDNVSGKLTDFSTNFSFIISSSQNITTQQGDGITFFLAEPNFPLPVPRDGSGIGLVSRAQLQDENYPNEHPFVAVEFDTFSNDWDPPYDHVGIDVKHIKTSYTTEWFRIKDGRRFYANISYNSSTKNLSVSFSGYKNNNMVEQSLHQIVNLKDVLPEWVEFGFSSATGLLYEEVHTLSSWSFYSGLDLEEDQNDKSKKGLIMGLSIGAGILILVLGSIWLVIWKMRYRYRDRLDNDFERSIGARRFSFQELVRATNNFAEENELGEGGFGRVYKGFMREFNAYAAIKKVSPGSKQGVKEYAAEVKIISQLRHKNLVQLLGWCHQKNDLLLIYDFMENGSLDFHLFKGKSFLTWETRYNIVRGLASAIVYLHEEWEQCVLHRDIKSSNVMLDSNFNAKLGDFGLARLVDHGKDTKTTVVAGTLGYLAPESAKKGKSNKASDVHSFGVVALEIACGRKPVVLSAANEEQIHLVDWVWELYGMSKHLEAADPRLSGKFDEKEMERLMIVGLWCAHPDYIMRPTIRQAIQVLNFEAPLPILPLQKPEPTNNARPANANSSSSFISSGISAFGINQTQPSSNSFSTESSESNTRFAVISPSATIPHTY